MKKLISIILALAMMLSLVIFATLPTAAIDGDWTVVAQAKQENGEIAEDLYHSVAGYEYTEEGFRVIPANWAGQTPWARFVSKQKVDLKDGVYMKIRIDEFDYNAQDAWFNVMLTDEQLVTPGETWDGDGVQNLIRPNYNYYTQWFIDGSFQQTPHQQGYENVPVVTDDDGKHNLTVAIAWDDANANFTYTINGVSAPQSVINYMNETWGGYNSEVYVGFCLQHNVKDGKVACTLLEYGKSADVAWSPMADDSRDPIDYSTNYVTAPVVDNPSFEYGQPGIFMNGDVKNSDIKDVPGSCTGESITINEDGSVKIVANNTYSAMGHWVVDNAISYAIEDLPIAMMVTRNLCTCTEEDKFDGRCGAFEEVSAYLMTGDTINASEQCMTHAYVSWDAYFIGDDSYLTHMIDVSDMSMFSGRINGIRFDVKNVDLRTPGANVFDVCFIAFFASEDDANEYFENYLISLGWGDPDAEEETTEEPEGPIEEECLEFRSNGDNTCTVVGIGSCTGDRITIPAVSPDGELVVGIGDSAFSRSGITEIIIPDSVTSIGDYAFYCCTGLESIELPDSVTTIGEGAFYCAALESVYIPDSVTSIGERAFSDCAGLMSITVDDNNPNYCSVGGVLFDKAKTTLIQYAAGKTAKKYTVLDSVTSIGSSAFSCCTSLESIDIPDSVVSVGDYAFSCSSLKSIELPDSVGYIGAAAFKYCTSLENIKLPHRVASVGEHTFFGCTSLVNIEIPDGITDICYVAFASCTSLESIVIPDSVSFIDDSSFSDCISLETVYYSGTEEQWAAISIGSNNFYLTNAMIVYNYLSEDDGENTTEESTWDKVEMPETTETPEQPPEAPEQTTEAPERTAADDEDKSDKDQSNKDQSNKDQSNDGDDENKSNNIGNAILDSITKGCGSAVGFGAVTVVAAIGTAGFVLFKKKEEK